MTILCIQWEYEDRLPDFILDEEFDIIHKKSEVRDGVRMYPFVWTIDEQGNEIKAFLG